jgi:hypothetical protein
MKADESTSTGMNMKDMNDRLPLFLMAELSKNSLREIERAMSHTDIAAYFELCNEYEKRRSGITS